MKTKKQIKQTIEKLEQFEVKCKKCKSTNCEVILESDRFCDENLIYCILIKCYKCGNEERK